MNIIISAHYDTVFIQPYGKIINGVLMGACDNIAGILAAAMRIEDTDLEIQFTEEEELHMDGARYLAKNHNPQEDFIIVLDVTEKKKGWKIHFTVENWHGITDKHIKLALKDFQGKYKLNKDGAESEAWLYSELGFACLELDVPVIGGLHSLDAKAQIVDILQVSRAIRAVADYITPKTREELSDIYKVGDEHNEPENNGQSV